MFSGIAQRYDLANMVLSFGMHTIWMRRALALLPKNVELTALDACTGTGALLPLLSKRYKNVTGLDFSAEMLARGRELRGLKMPLIEGDACAMPFAAHSFDIVTVAYGVRNLSSLEAGLAEFKRVLKPGGYLMVLEFGQPQGLLWGALFRFYSRYLMPVIGGLISGNSAAYRYLPETAARFPCGEEFTGILERSGFASVSKISLNGGIAYAYLGWRRCDTICAQQIKKDGDE